MVSASQIREIVRNYLAGVISLQDFADSFEAKYSALDEASEFEALALGDQIQTLLGRVSAGYSVEADLREALRPLTFASLSTNVVIGIPSFFVSVNQYSVAESAFPAPSDRVVSGRSHMHSDMIPGHCFECIGAGNECLCICHGPVAPLDDQELRRQRSADLYAQLPRVDCGLETQPSFTRTEIIAGLLIIAACLVMLRWMQ